MAPDPPLTAEQPRASLPRRLGAALRRRPRTSAAAGALLLAAAAVAGVFTWAAYQFHAAGRALGDGDAAAALAHVRLGLRVRPDSAEGHLLAARAERQGGDYPAAERDLQTCIRLQNGATAATQMEWLMLRAQRGEVDEVAPGLWYCVEQGHPDSDAILEALARAYMHQFRLGAALECLDRWLARRPDCPRALDWRGWVHERLEQREAARQDYRRALELDPGRSEVRMRLAAMLLDDAKPAEAAPHLERLRHELPGRTGVLVSLAHCRAMEGDFAEARRLTDEVLARHPDDAEALLELGRLDLEEGRAADAEAALRHGLKVSPYRLPIRFSLWQSLQRQPGREGDAAEAKAAYDALKTDLDRLTKLLGSGGSKSREDPAAAAEVGALLLRTGEERLALEWLDVALKLDPRSPGAHETLAAYYEKKGEAEKAEEHRRAARQP
ncbi:MAG TPA: tetratricopeptide repeat protein [Gemmataceae bacterium]|nr:tetratricopeptide repeat protein [Gemmataceae bacterium]